MSAARVRTKYAGVYKRGGRYSYTYADNLGRTKWGSAATLAEAKAAKAAAAADVARGEYRTLSRIRFEDYAVRWIEAYGGRTRRGIGPETLTDYRRALGLDAEGNPTGDGAVAFFRGRRLVEIDPSDVKAYAAHVASRPRQRGSGRRSAGTVRLALVPVKTMLADAVEEGLIRFNPAAVRIAVGVAAEAESIEEHVKALDEKELAALLDAVPEESRLFFQFLAQTGLRISEAIELRWRDLDLGGRWLHVQRRFYRGRVAKPKGRKTRKVRLSEGIARSLWALRKETRAGADDLVFTAARGSRIDQSNLMSRVLKPAAASAGLGEWIDTKTRHGKPGRRAESWVGFHTFRHTCATILFRRGWNASQVQKFLGHSDPGFTLRRYVHLLDDDLPTPDFFDDLTSPTGGKKEAMRAAETAGDASIVKAAESA